MLECLKGFVRPCGVSLTLHAAVLCGFDEGASIIDIGCGAGRAVEALASHGFEAVGIDADEAYADTRRVICADATRLPFDENRFDGAFMECSLSRIADADSALIECRRVLKTGAKLALSDVVSHGDEITAYGVLGRLENPEHIRDRLHKAGFRVMLEEDYTRELRSLFAEMLMEAGSDAAKAYLGAPYEEIKRAKCGYKLFICERKD